MSSIAARPRNPIHYRTGLDMRYDPDIAPPAAQWLALDQNARIAAIALTHAAELPDLELHVAIHAAVETQLAQNIPSVTAAAARLQTQGLDRHDTIHAIGAVLAGHMWEMLQADPADGDPNAAYYSALDDLSAESWRRDYGASSEDG